MIVSFFLICNYAVKLFKKSSFKCAYEQLTKNHFEKSDPIKILESLEFPGTGIFDEEYSVRFIPPVYYQRYQAVYDILSELQWIYDIKKVVDIGCSEIAFFVHVKRLEVVEEYIGVDIDLSTLERSKCRVEPLHVDYLVKRCVPLHALILNGCASHSDERLKGANAVVAIELIEHMFPRELDDLPYNILGVIQPDVAIFTTPNSDFNVLFKTLDSLFRHPDHKFEWSRNQFEDWGNNLALRYPMYEVFFIGIGRGPEGTESYGCCSQLAAFVRVKEKTATDDFSVFYKTVFETQYPYQTPEEKFNGTLEYEVYQFIDFCSGNDKYLVGDLLKIPLSDIRNYINVSCTFEKLKEFLIRSEKKLECVNNEFILVLPLNIDNSSTSDSFDGNNVTAYINQEESEVWDIKLDSIHCNEDMDDDKSWTSFTQETKPSENHFDEPFATSQVSLSCTTFVKETGIVPSEVCRMNDNGYDCSNEKVLSNNLEKFGDCSAPCERHFDVSIARKDVIDGKYIPPSLITKSGAIPKVIPAPSNVHIAPVTKDRKFLKDGNIENNFIPQLIEETPQNIYSKDELFSFKEKSSSVLPYDVLIKPENTTTGSTDQKLAPLQSDEILLSEKYTSSFENNDCKKKSTKLNEKKLYKVHESLEVGNSFSSCELLQKKLTHASTDDKPTRSVGIDQLSGTGTLPRSQSLENIYISNTKNKNFRHSLNIEKEQIDADTTIVDMELDVCYKVSSIPSLTETCASLSRALDSGYPNSTQDMELDLTPEQVDEIITETESSLEDEDSSADERGADLVQGNPLIVFADNVENGDVANNNRDGEGNNMEVIAEELVFEDIVMGGEEAEAAGEQESDDEGLFMSALDVSKSTIVQTPLEFSSDDTLYMFDLPLDSSASVSVPEEEASFAYGFPAWLLNIMAYEVDHGIGDAGPDMGEDGAEPAVMDQGEQVDLYPPNARAAGEPTLPEL